MKSRGIEEEEAKRGEWMRLKLYSGIFNEGIRNRCLFVDFNVVIPLFCLFFYLRKPCQTHIRHFYAYFNRCVWWIFNKDRSFNCKKYLKINPPITTEKHWLEVLSANQHQLCVFLGLEIDDHWDRERERPVKFNLK